MLLTLAFKPESVEETEGYIEFTVRAISADTPIQSAKGEFYFPSELLIKKQADLIGKPLLLDHEWKVDKIVGVVVHSWFDDSQKALMARVRVTKEGNERLVSLIKMSPSPIKSVSIGAVLTKEKDKVVDIEFKELSLVFEGADPNARLLSKYEDITLSTAEWWDDPELRDKAPQDYFLDPSSRRYPYKTWEGKISCERLKAAMQLSSLHGHRQIYDRAKRLYEKHCQGG
ncbi:MAG: hypothetical protein WHS43_06920 [Aquificaceae bacterium]|jgi:SAM-dependent methyltransferase|uniref:hypothetical protein n=1 Tax=Hydrogenobacter sp. Uz 6-8 TaxID=3384828 RepID=UPI0030A5B187